MHDDDQTSGEETNEPLMTPEAQKRLLYAAAVLILMAGSFMAGRYSVQGKAQSPLTQIPTPLPMGTPSPVPESAFTMINFTDVSAPRKAEVLSAFNTEICSCRCGMSVAACIVKDPNCPFWKEHVTKFQTALGNGKKPDLSKAPKQPMGGFPQMPQGMTGALPPAQSLPLPSGK